MNQADEVLKLHDEGHDTDEVMILSGLPWMIVRDILVTNGREIRPKKVHGRGVNKNIGKCGVKR